MKFIRKKFEDLEKNADKEISFTMFTSEDVLAKDWNNNSDERWNNI